MDPTVLERFGMLLAARNTGRKFAYCGLGEQDFLIVCATPAQCRRLDELTGLQITWLVQSVVPRRTSDDGAAGATIEGSPGVSKDVLRVTARPDRLAWAIKFGCGAPVGFLFGFLLGGRFLPIELQMNMSSWVISGLLGSVVVGLLATKF